MGGFAVPADEALRSKLEYGTPDFPFACYTDELERYKSRCVEWHWHREFEFSYVLGGDVVCHLGPDRLELKGGDGLFINSGTIHRFETAGHGVLANFIFSPEFLAEPSSVIYLKYVRPVFSARLGYVPLRQEDPDSAPMLRLLRDTDQTLRSQPFGKELLLRDRVSALWYLFLERHLEVLSEQTDRGGLAMERLQRMMAYIHTHYPDQLTLAEIAASANISKSEALRCFHLIRSTPVQYLNEYRLNRARERLLSSCDPVTAISEAVGFESVGYFCQAFKKRTGHSPNVFRKRFG